MNCIILGDKYKKGMKSKGCSALISFNKSTILHNQYSVLKQAFPSCKIIYIGGFESKKVETLIIKQYTDIIFINNDLYEQKNEGYSLFLSKDFLNENTIIVSGYSILEDKLWKTFSIHDYSQVFVSSRNDNEIGCAIQNNSVLHIDFGLDNHITDMYYICKAHIGYLKNVIEDQSHHNCFLFEIINKLIDNNLTVKPYYKIIKKKHGYIK